MKNRAIMMTAMVLMLFSIEASADQPETLITCIEGVDTSLNYGEYTVCEFNDVTDGDKILFQGQANDVIRVEVVDDFSDTENPEFRIRVNDPDSMEIYHTTFDDRHRYTKTLEKSGEYEIVLYEQNLNEVGAFYVLVERMNPVPPVTALPYDTSVCDTIIHYGDFDFFTFCGVQATEVVLNFQDVDGNPEFFIEVWDPNGTRIYSKQCDNTCSTAPISIPFDGTYLVGISEHHLNESGAYCLEVICNTGDCTCPTGCAGTGGASTMGRSPEYAASDLGKHLAFLILPLAAIIVFGLRPRKE